MSRTRLGLVSVVAFGLAAFAVPAGGAQALSPAPQTAAATAQSRPGAAGAACAAGHVKGRAGVMKYTACKKGKRIRVSGSLNDTRHNRRCLRARIRFEPSGPDIWYKDCGGRPTRFDTGWQRAENGRMTLH